jgi:hypothetical protein
MGRFSKKNKQKSTGCNRIFDRVLPSQPGRPGHDFFYFFINPARFQSRIDPSGRVSKLFYEVTKLFFKKINRNAMFIKLVISTSLI